MSDELDEIKAKKEVGEYYILKQRIKELQAKEKYLREILISKFGEGTFSKGPFVLEIKKVSQKRLNSKKVREFIPKEKLEEFLTISEYFKLSVKKVED